MAFTLDLTGLATYIDENKDQLLTKIPATMESTKYMNVQTNVLADREMHGLITNLTIQDGSNCGFSPEGSQTISGRILAPNYLKVNTQYCPKDFLGTYAAYQTSIAMGKGNLPLEEALVNDIIKAIAQENEKLIWAGDKSSGDLVDGFITLFDADAAIPAGNKVTSTLTGALDRLQEMYKALPSNKHLSVVCSMTLYRELVTDLVNKNLVVWNTAADGENEQAIFTLPGTKLTVYGLEGIPETEDRFFAFDWNQMFYGCDGTGDKEAFDFFWSADDRVYKLDVEWVSTVNYQFSDGIYIYGK